MINSTVTVLPILGQLTKALNTTVLSTYVGTSNYYNIYNYILSIRCLSNRVPYKIYLASIVNGIIAFRLIKYKYYFG